MTEQQQQLNAMIERIERHQAALKLSDTRFVARYQRYLGSAKSWRERLIGRQWNELGKNLGKWLAKLRSFCAEIDGTADMGEFFCEMPIAKYGQGIYDALQGQQSDRRVAFVIGPTGVGKSWTMRWIARENITNTAYVHANRGWKDSMMQIARGFARALGATEETGGASTFLNVVENLKANPITVIVDDVHEGGILMLKLIKHLVDDTRAKFILGTYPTAWNQLVNGSTDAHAEAQQLVGRALKPVNKAWMQGATETDVATFLRLTMGGNGECQVLAEHITPLIRRHGNLRALADAIELARMNADNDDKEIDSDLVEASIHELCPMDRK